MKRPWKSRLLALLLVLGMLFTMAPMAFAEDETGSGTGTPQEGVDGDGTPTDDTEEPAEPVYTLTSVTVTNSSISMKVDETRDLKISVKISDGSTEKEYTKFSEIPEELALDVKWTVENGRGEEVSVMQSADDPFTATVKALKPAETTETKPVTVTVTVTPNGESNKAKRGIYDITVTPNDPAGVSVTPAEEEIAPKQTLQLKASVTPETADQTVTWRTANSAIATVSNTGLVTGVAAGETTITATSVAGGKEASCAVTVQGIVLKDKSVTIKKGSNYNLGYTIYGPSIKNNTVTWTSSDPAIVRVDNGYLYGLAEGTVTITAKVEGVTYTAACEVKVESNTAEVITASVDAGAPLNFSAIQSKIQTQSTNVLGRSLSYISGLSIATSQGTLYYRYQTDSDTGAGIGTGERYYVSPSLGQMAISDIYFVPKADFSGTAVINYTGYADGTTFFQGTIEITVAQLQEIAYSTTGQKAVQFSVDDFNRMCRSRTGRDINYVMFAQPTSSQGALYYGYISAQNFGSKVDEAKQYRRNGSPSLSEVYFVPSGSYTGDVIITYTAYDVNGDSFRGRVKVRVSQSSASGDLNYSISQGGRLTLSDDDFNSLSKSITGYNLDYVRFTLPSSSEGTLYYNYTSSTNYDSKVADSKSYYRSSAPYLRRVTFVAASNYTGTVSLDFTAWDVKGNQFSGIVEIAVGEIKRGDVRYSTHEGVKVTFDDNDFNSVCKELTGGTLKYVRFTLPDSSEGTLYYNYNNGDYDSRVTASKSYYRSSSPYLDKVTFVPKSGFTGTVSIEFVGYNTDDVRFDGTVEIGVDSGGEQIAYTVRYGGTVTFNDSDFDSFSEYMTGNRLRYVRFELPSSSKGTLYYDYDDGDFDSKVTETKSYYRTTSPYLEKVTFVPADGFAGTVSIDFTGWSTNNEKFEGTVDITVSAPAGPSLITYSTSYAPVTFKAQDFINACSARGVGSLKSVQFTPPSTSVGRLYYRYSSVGMSGTEVRSGTTYYPDSTPNLSEVCFVPKLGYQGTVTISYTGTDSNGNTYQGQIQITVQPSTYSKYFSDLYNYSWAVQSVDFLYENGVVSGAGAGTYGPSMAISRGDFMLMLCRAFNLQSSSAANFPDVPAGSYYAQAIQTARSLGIASGYPDGGFHPQNPVSRQDAMVFLKRAMQAAGWSLGSGSSSLLNGFSDGAQVADYAKDAVATMISYGVLTGTSNGTLAPNTQMTRAEMAVVLARVLTM